MMTLSLSPRIIRNCFKLLLDMAWEGPLWPCSEESEEESTQKQQT